MRFILYCKRRSESYHPIIFAVRSILNELKKVVDNLKVEFSKSLLLDKLNC